MKVHHTQLGRYLMFQVGYTQLNTLEVKTISLDLYQYDPVFINLDIEFSIGCIISLGGLGIISATQFILERKKLLTILAFSVSQWLYLEHEKKSCWIAWNCLVILKCIKDGSRLFWNSIPSSLNICTMSNPNVHTVLFCCSWKVFGQTGLLLGSG